MSCAGFASLSRLQKRKAMIQTFEAAYHEKVVFVAFAFCSMEF